MMTQEIIVYIIGIVVAACIAVWLYRIIARRKNPCGGCSGCDAKTIYEAKRKSCDTGRKGGHGCGCAG